MAPPPLPEPTAHPVTWGEILAAAQNERLRNANARIASLEAKLSEKTAECSRAWAEAYHLRDQNLSMGATILLLEQQLAAVRAIVAAAAAVRGTSR